MCEEEKKNKYPWDSLDTTTLMLPNEIIAYHLYRYEKSNKKRSEEVKTLKKYISSMQNKDEEVVKCSQK